MHNVHFVLKVQYLMLEHSLLKNYGGTVMKSLLLEQGVKKMMMIGAAFFVGVVILIALLEKLALILAYYFT
jgi:hypothetical protein